MKFSFLGFLFALAAVNARTANRGGKNMMNAKLSEKTENKIREGKRLNLRERKELRSAEKAKYIQLRSAGADEVSNTKEAAALRAYKLRAKKRKGLIRKREASLAEVLFPGVAPNNYMEKEPIWMNVDLVDSRKTPIPYEYYDLPMCEKPQETAYGRKRRERKNLGQRLQGHKVTVAPMQTMRVKEDQTCTPICMTTMSSKDIRFMRRLIERQYRVQITLDSLPALMRVSFFLLCDFRMKRIPLLTFPFFTVQRVQLRHTWLSTRFQGPARFPGPQER